MDTETTEGKGAMEICSKCKTENDEGVKFCACCGNRLEAKDLTPEIETIQRKKNVQICPRCRVIYEKEEHCVKCKSKLVPNSPSGEESEVSLSAPSGLLEPGGLLKPHLEERLLAQPLETGPRAVKQMRVSDLLEGGDLPHLHTPPKRERRPRRRPFPK